MAMNTKTYEALNLHKSPTPNFRDRKVSEDQPIMLAIADGQYNPCTEAHPVEGVPTGDVYHVKDWSDSRMYPDTSRDFWIYTPHDLDKMTEAPALAFFNDGAGYLSRDGHVRASHVLDNLIHAEKIPPTVGVFVNPGQPTDPSSDRNLSQRSYEYDSLTPDFINFINDEILPLVEQHIGRTLHTDPTRRLICGISSGGICAFNAAWHSPGSFGLVLSHCGSFTNIRGGHNFPYLIRSTESKPVKVFLQSGKLDLNIYMGSWAVANHDMAEALKYSGYNYQFVFGEGGHSLRHGGAIFADSLRWLFSSEPADQ